MTEIEVNARLREKYLPVFKIGPNLVVLLLQFHTNDLNIFGRLDKELTRCGVDDKIEDLTRNLKKLEPERKPPDRDSGTPDRDPGTLSTALSSTRLCHDDDSSPIPNMNRRFGKLLESLKKVRMDLDGEDSGVSLLDGHDPLLHRIETEREKRGEGRTA